MRFRESRLVFVAVLATLGLAHAALGDQGVMPRGMPAYPGLVKHVQPDGTVFEARQYGDEAYHWMETAAGYTVEQNRQSGFYEYVALDNAGQFKRTGLIVGRDNPAAAGLAKFARESLPVIAAKRSEIARVFRAPGVKPPTPLIYPSSGSLKVLVILVNFEDTTTRTSQQRFDRLFNADQTSSPPAPYTVKTFWDAASYGKVAVTATIAPWVTVTGTHDSYADPRGMALNSPNLVRRAVDELYKMGFDFSPFDLNGDGDLEPVIVIHQGEGQEFSGDPTDIWSYSYQLFPRYPVDGSTTSPGRLRLFVNDYTLNPELQNGLITTIGVLVHEMGHAFGLPDLYDTTYRSQGVGNWCLMAGGSWNRQVRSGDLPALLSAYCKLKLGWIDPTVANRGVVMNARIGELLDAVEQKPDVLMINMGPSPSQSGEYLLLENRQWIGFDRGLPNYGLLVWHVDERMASNDDPQHYMVGLLQADGLKDLENNINRGDKNDPFPGWLGVRALGPYSLKEGVSFNPSTNSYYYGDTNILIENISNPTNPMKIDIRFLPNLFFRSDSQVLLQPANSLRPPVTFRNGSQRPFFSLGDPILYALDIVNRDLNFPYAPLIENAPPAGVEFWGSRTGGLTLDFMAAFSTQTATISGNGFQLLAGEASLAGFPDGSYTFVATIDRLNRVRESTKADNMLLPNKQGFLIIRPATKADLTVRNFTFGPNWLKKGDKLQLGGQVVNQGTQDSGPFFIEFWGSFDQPNKYYPTLDFFLCDSIGVPNLGPGGAVNLAGFSRTLYKVPNHAVSQSFTVLCFADRNDQVNESNETNNYQAVRPVNFSTLAMGKTAAAPAVQPAAEPSVGVWQPHDEGFKRAQLDLPELSVQYATVTLSGQQPPLYLQLVMNIANFGTTATPTVANVYVSRDLAVSPDDYVWAAGVPVPLLKPGQNFWTVVPVGLPALPQGAYFMFAECDARKQIAEVHEDNNILLAGPVIVGSDLAFDFFTYNETHALPVPSLGVQFSEPGSSVTVALRLANRGLIGTDAFWLEFWGSRRGGLSLDEFLADSRFMPPIGPLSAADVFDVLHLNSVPDGPYTMTAAADRLGQVRNEVFRNNNRAAVADRRLLELRPIRGCNLRLAQFRFAPNPVGRGELIKWNGSILNDGGEYTGPFWIEFWASRSKGLPSLDFQICDSIYVDTLRPGQQYYLVPNQRQLYTNIPTGEVTIYCVVDRADNISEPDETDNFKSALGVKIR